MPACPFKPSFEFPAVDTHNTLPRSKYEADAIWFSEIRRQCGRLMEALSKGVPCSASSRLSSAILAEVFLFSAVVEVRDQVAFRSELAEFSSLASMFHSCELTRPSTANIGLVACLPKVLG